MRQRLVHQPVGLHDHVAVELVAPVLAARQRHVVVRFLRLSGHDGQRQIERHEVPPRPIDAGREARQRAVLVPEVLRLDVIVPPPMPARSRAAGHQRRPDRVVHARPAVAALHVAVLALPDADLADDVRLGETVVLARRLHDGTDQIGRAAHIEVRLREVDRVERVLLGRNLGAGRDQVLVRVDALHVPRHLARPVERHVELRELLFVPELPERDVGEGRVSAAT